jgi:hypothetical protein
VGRAIRDAAPLLAIECTRCKRADPKGALTQAMEGAVGDADSRQEISASPSLEVLQTRHRQMMRAVDVSPAERGEVLPTPPRTQALGERDNLSPAGVVSDGVQQLHTRFAVGSGESERAPAPVGSGTARDEGAEESRGVPLRDAHERAHENVRALSGATIGDDEGESRGNREDQHETARAPEPDAEHAAPHVLEHEGGDAVADTLRPAPPRPEEP